MNAPTVRQSFCRVCNCNCGILVQAEDGHVTRVIGDPAHPVTAGYTCVKGRAQPELLAHASRLLRSRKRIGSAAARRACSRTTRASSATPASPG